jgi:hypothetical protein
MMDDKYDIVGQSKIRDEMHSEGYAFSKKERRRRKATFSLTMDELVEICREAGLVNGYGLNEVLIREGIKDWFKKNG